MNVKIDGENVLFTKFTPLNNGLSGTYYCDSHKRYFMKYRKEGLKINIAVLDLLKKYDHHFPKLVTYSSTFIITEYIHGASLTIKTVPTDLQDQVSTISNILEDEKICHGDIHINQFIVSNGILMLVDFEGSFIYETPPPPPHGLVRFRLRKWHKSHPDYSNKNKSQMMKSLESFL